MHHSRRKSGQGAASAPGSEVRSAHRTRTSGGSSKKAKEGRGGRSPKEREKEYYEYCDDEGGRDTFPQYCMTCEKQFLPPDDSCLYCSEACREYDSTTSPGLLRGSASNGYAPAPTPYYAAREPREIVPRASPSRPAPTPTYLPAAPNDAVTALRSLTIRPASPSGGGWPFGEKYSATYDAAYGKRGGGYGYGYGYAYGSSGERPLPSRRPGYSRPKSTELVTPVVGR